MSKFVSKNSSFILGVVAVSFFVLSGVRTVQAALITATGLVGQTDANGNPVYTTNAANNGSSTPNAQGLDNPTSSVLDPVDHRIFVADSNNNRVVVFPLDANNHIASTTAIFVLGASDFNTISPSVATRNTFGGVNIFGYVLNIAYDSVNKRLFVSDPYYNRVLGFDVPADATSSINGENADFVLGQADFISSGFGITQNKLGSTDNLIFDAVNNRLFVSDESSQRIMIFSVPGNATSSINGENADYVLGQPDFFSHSSSITRNGLYNPTGLAVDTGNNRLFVSDANNNRVMVFGVPPGTNITGENADYVLGQSDFTTKNATTTRNGFNHPDDIMGYDSSANRLFVSDSGNERVLVFSVPPGANITGENAQNVLGQNDYTSFTTGVTQNKFGRPNGQDSFDPANNRLFVKDKFGNRVMEFSMIHITTKTLTGGTTGSAYSETIATANAQGTSQSFSLYGGSLPDGLSLDPSTGVISGTPTAATTSSFTIEADDNFSTGPFFDRAAYSLTVASSTAVPPTPAPTPNTATGSSHSSSGGFVSVSVLATLLTPSASTTAYLESLHYKPVPIFSRNLTIGSVGNDVRSIQIYLNNHGYKIADTGPGSPGYESSIFGPLTRKALMKLQKDHGISPAAGYFGPITRAYVNGYR